MKLAMIKKLLLSHFSKSKEKDWNAKLNLLLEAELAKALSDNTPISEYLTLTRAQALLNKYKDDEKCICALYSMYTSEGWRYFSSQLRALQVFIEKKLASDVYINQKEELSNRVEYAVYNKLIAKELFVRERYKGIMKDRATQTLKKTEEKS